MNKIKVTVERRVREVWEFYVDADKLDIPANSEGLTPGQFGDACDALHDAINSVTDETSLMSADQIDSTIDEESIIKWKPVGPKLCKNQ